MVNDTLEKIESIVRNARSIDEDRRQELSVLVETLRREVTSLSATHGEHAQSIAGFTQMAAHEVLRDDRDEQLQSLSMDGLKSSVARFEASHPRLVEAVSSIHQALANIGLE